MLSSTLTSAVVIVCTAVALLGAPPTDGAWQQIASQQQNPAPVWTPDQLRNLVAPVALYPDPLLGQILAASTYPLEIVEARQWIGQNSGITAQALVDALKQQGWDPSVQMLAEFPEAMDLLNRDIRWTTDLGNAFLSQQGDVMDAIQSLRMEARNSGTLQSTQQQVVSTETENGQSAVSIEPANPQVIYPPVYNPAAVWGAPASGSYPAFSYASPAPYYGVGYSGGYGGGYGFGPGINIGALFSGLVNWNGWGWVLGWFTHSLSLASLFFNILGFHGFGGGGIGAGFHSAGVGTMTLWSHDPSHRLGVPYPRGFSARSVAPIRENSGRMMASASPASASRMPGLREQWNSGQRYSPPRYSGLSSASPQRFSEPERYNSPIRNSDPQRYNEPMQRYSASNFSLAQRFGSPQSFGSQQRYSGSPSFAPPRSQSFSETKYASPKYSEPKYSAQRFSAPKFSAPKFSAPKAPKFSVPKSSGGHSSGKSHKH